MIGELAKKLTAFEEFADFVIIEIIFRRGKFSSGAEIVKNFSSRVILRAASSDAEVFVKMIRPRSDLKFPDKKSPAENFWRTFSTEEILNFVAAVGDKNKIHPPIVPAFLILEKICAEFSACKELKLRFKNFITTGEPLTLKIFDKRFEITCADDKKVLGEMS